MSCGTYDPLSLNSRLNTAAKFSMKYIYESKNATEELKFLRLAGFNANALQKAARSCQLADAKRRSCTCIIFGLYVLYLGSYTCPFIHSFSCEDRIGSQLAYFFKNLFNFGKPLRAHDCKYRESLARLKESKILTICQKNPFGELSSKKMFLTFKNL